MIRKFIICVFTAIFLNEWMMWTFFDVVPRPMVASLGFIVAIAMLLRLLIFTIFIEHIMRQHGSRMDQD